MRIRPQCALLVTVGVILVYVRACLPLRLRVLGVGAKRPGTAIRRDYFTSSVESSVPTASRQAAELSFGTITLKRVLKASL
jgi:hypothetical protein